MVYLIATAVSLLALAQLPAVLGHARVTTNPPIRSPGPLHKQTCGQPSFNSISQDPTGHIEEQQPVNAGCELTLCRGMLFADQPVANVKTVKPLQAMSMGIDCTVPHGGPANVSLIDTTVGGAGQRIGGFLKTFDDFCPTSGPTPADQLNLQYNLPDQATIGNRCQNPGDCVVSLFWATPDGSQNYYYCQDVVMAAVQIPTTSSTLVPTTSTRVVVQTTSSTPVVVQVPTTAALPATTPLRFTTSLSVNSIPTGVAAAANTNGTAVKAQQAGAARRRARILWL